MTRLLQQLPRVLGQESEDPDRVARRLAEGRGGMPLT